MPLTSREERGGSKGRPPATPWLRMLRHRAVWAIILNNFTFHYAFYVVMNWLPTYFDKVPPPLPPSLAYFPHFSGTGRFRVLREGEWCITACDARFKPVLCSLAPGLSLVSLQDLTRRFKIRIFIQG